MRIKQYSSDPVVHSFYSSDGETALVIRDDSNTITDVNVPSSVLEDHVQVTITDPFGNIVGIFPDDSTHTVLNVTGIHILSNADQMIAANNQPVRTELRIRPTIDTRTHTINELKGIDPIATVDDEDVYQVFYTQELDDFNLEVSYFNSSLDVSVFDQRTLQTVESYYFEIHELRDNSRLTSTTEYPNELLKMTRSQVEAFFDDVTLSNWTLMADVFKWSNLRESLLPTDKNITLKEIHTLKEDGTVNPDSTDYDKRLSDIGITKFGQLYFKKGTGKFNPYGYEVRYIWGEGSIPADLKRAAIRYAEHILLNDPSTIPDRARMLQTSQGMLLLDVASMQKPTGLPEVDSILLRYRRKEVTTIA